MRRWAKTDSCDRVPEIVGDIVNVRIESGRQYQSASLIVFMLMEDGFIVWGRVEPGVPYRF